MRKKKFKYEELRLIWGYMIIKGQRNSYLSFYLRVQMFRMETLNESCAFSFLLKQKKHKKTKKSKAVCFLLLRQGKVILPLKNISKMGENYNKEIPGY